MRIIEADCEIEYEGRGATNRGRAVRLIMIKSDGSFLIHRDVGVKPLNYMTKVESMSEESYPDYDVLTVIGKKDTLEVIIYRRIMDMMLDMPADDSVSIVNGTERQLQEWLSREENWNAVFGHGRFTEREHRTTVGPVDLIGSDDDGTLIIVEVKRHAANNDVFQVLRYQDAIERGHEAKRMECWLVAETMKPETIEQCREHGVRTAIVDPGWRTSTIVAEDAGRTATPKRKRRGHAKPLPGLGAVPVI